MIWMCGWCMMFLRWSNCLLDNWYTGTALQKRLSEVSMCALRMSDLVDWPVCKAGGAKAVWYQCCCGLNGVREQVFFSCSCEYGCVRTWLPAWLSSSSETEWRLGFLARSLEGCGVEWYGGGGGVMRFVSPPHSATQARGETPQCESWVRGAFFWCLVQLLNVQCVT